MHDRRTKAEMIQTHYEEVWRRGDAWDLEASAFEQDRYDYLARLLAERCPGKILEIGCGSGGLTRRLAEFAEQVVAIDVAQGAIDRAVTQFGGTVPPTVTLLQANVVEYDLDAEGPWDAIVLAETIYSLGWLYSFFEVGYLAHRLLAATRPQGTLLLSNAFGQEKDWLLHPSLICTYRDLFCNVGYQIAAESVFQGTKHDVPIDVLVTLFQKPAATA
jgi:16S rRNA A1518/A1519 N6-dimethyltransferase RsmA/KsgA/DIM1 with predicted DNA glycosylase/AP lyase activity